ncbi:uncharacterized protein LOC124264569 [Haliotis rubra]|uniref:uncharacterized protein LOC124264569 n=1 Tax=Haliotis rubra TaxID=36100 RepID=UPI001EE6224A|nr:uncharacterized protein LOC124264569 [Haliotis rubra]
MKLLHRCSHNMGYCGSLRSGVIIISVLSVATIMLNKVTVDMYSGNAPYTAPSRIWERKVHIIGSDRVQSGIQKSTPNNRKQKSTPNNRKSKVIPRGGTRCPSVLDNMSKGHWKQRVMTKQEVFTQEKFLNHSRKQLNIISPISRPDGLCGNFTLPYNRQARALCYPTSKTPCCFNNRCVALPEEKCRCKNCYDVRQRVHAEYATWIPADKRCSFHVFTGKEACQLLANSTLFLFGDSHFRHFYTAMLMLLRNDPIGGGLKDKDRNSNVTLKNCPGPYQFGSKECRPTLELKAKPLCNGSFNLKYISHTKASQGPDLYNKIKAPGRRKKTLAMISLAAREGNNVTKFMEYLKPALNFVKNTSFKYPKLMWANGHAPGLLKSPVYERQGLQYMKKANDNMHKLLRPLGIPVFDTFNMTSTTISFDGTHYGYGATTAKVQLLLNYLKELQGKHQW